MHLASGLTLVPHVDAYYQSSTLSHLDVTEAASDPLSELQHLECPARAEWQEMDRWR